MVHELEGLRAIVDDVAASVLGTRDEFLYKAFNTRQNHAKRRIAVVVQVGMEQQLDDVWRVGGGKRNERGGRCGGDMF